MAADIRVAEGDYVAASGFRIFGDGWDQRAAALLDALDRDEPDA